MSIPAPTSVPTNKPVDIRPTSGFVRQLSKNDIKSTTVAASVEKSRTLISPTQEKVKMMPTTTPTVIPPTNFEPVDNSPVMPPVVEKSYLISSPEKLSNVTTGMSVEKSRLSSNSTKLVTSNVDTATKNVSSVSPTHFVGGWKAPTSPTKEIQNPFKVDRNSTAEDNEDRTLLERVG